MDSLIEQLSAALPSQYEVERELASGGMGTVFLARDTVLDRRVAIKVLRAGQASPSAAKRLLDEARILARLNHPNVVSVYHAGEVGESFYYIMDYVEGETLEERLKRGALPLDEVVKLGSELLAALEAAHEHGIVHRDVKPSNVFLVGDRALLGDFGIAKRMETSATGLTEPGHRMGTPGYMAPEQVAGDDVGPATDICAVGMVLYEALTGRKWSLLRPADEVDWSGVPRSLMHVLQRALQWSPDDRWSDIASFRHALLQASRPRTARGGVIAMTATAGALALSVAAGWLLFAGRTDRETMEAEAGEPFSERKILVVLPFENLGPTEDEYFADGITEEIMARLAGIDRLGVIARTSAMQYKNTDKSVEQIGEELGVDYILDGTVRWQRSLQGPRRVRVTPQLIRVADATQLWAHIYDENMAEVFQVQSAIAEQVTKALDIALLEPERQSLEAEPTENLQAYDYYLRGNDYFNRGWEEDDLRIAIQMYQKAVELDPNFALASAKLSTAHAWFYWFYYDRTEGRLGEAKAAADKALEIDPDLPEAHMALGWYHYHGKLDYDRALEQFAIAEKRQPNNSDLLLAIAAVQRRQGKWTQSVTNYSKASVLDPRSALKVNQLGVTYLWMRNYLEAERHLDRGISLAPDWPVAYAAKALLDLSWYGSTEEAWQELKSAAESVDPAEVVVRLASDFGWSMLFRVFLDNYRETLGQLSLSSFGADTASYFLAKAALYSRIGQHKLEGAYYDSARADLERRVQAQPGESFFHAQLGIAYAGLGRENAGIREGKAAVDLLPVSKEAVRGVLRVLNLAQIYVMIGDYDAAIDRLEFLLSVPAPVSLPLLRVDPAWTAIRGHPRFQDLARGKR